MQNEDKAKNTCIFRFVLSTLIELALICDSKENRKDAVFGFVEAKPNLGEAKVSARPELMQIK